MALEPTPTGLQTTVDIAAMNGPSGGLHVPATDHRPEANL